MQSKPNNLGDGSLDIQRAIQGGLCDVLWSKPILVTLACPCGYPLKRVSKTYMTQVEGENTRLGHYLARLHRKTLCWKG